MRVNWRVINAANNSYAVLYAACEKRGYTLAPSVRPKLDITCYSLNSLNVHRYKGEVANATCTTIVGGPHATACHDEVASFADYVVVGEGERVLPDLLEYLDGEREELPAGVATSDGYCPSNHTIVLDAFPPFSKIKGYIEISRGCPHQCGFCQTPRIFGPAMRHRSVDVIAHHARRYRDLRFVSPNAFAYGSDGCTLRCDKIEALLRKLRGNIYFGTFPCEVRPEFITPESLELVRTFCSNTRLHFGAQSGSDAVLAALMRGHTVDDIVTGIDLCHDHGLTPIVDFILGLPMETDNDQRATLRLITYACRFGKAHVHYFVPLPGTVLAHTTPRPLLPETKKMLGKMALSGKVTGAWSDHQIQFLQTVQDVYPW